MVVAVSHSGQTEYLNAPQQKSHLSFAFSQTHTSVQCPTTLVSEGLGFRVWGCCLVSIISEVIYVHACIKKMCVHGLSVSFSVACRREYIY